MDEQEVARVVSRTGSLLPWRRKAANAVLLAAGAAAVDPILALFARERRARKRRTTAYRYLANGVLAFTVSSVIGCILGGASPAIWMGLVAPSALLLLWVYALSMIQSDTRRQALLANALALFDDLRVIGPLAEALHYKQRSTLFPVKTRQKAINTLTVLLPHLDREQADLLDAEHRTDLRAELAVCRSADLVVAIIEALTRLGDTPAIPYVRAIARRANNPGQPVAQRCLVELEAAAEQERQSQTLLRATAAESETPRTVLLRAAQSGPATDPQQLLRATEEKQP